MSDEKNVELGVFEALNALAEEKNASAETRETLRKNVRQSSESQAAPAERRRPGRPKKEKAPELPLDEAIATGLTNLRNAKAKHAPAPKAAAPAVSEAEVASTLNSLFAAAEKQPAEAESAEAPAAQERVANTPLTERSGRRGGIHNSLTRILIKPSHLIGGYAQFSYAFNYYGPTGNQRDEVTLIRRRSQEVQF